MGFDFFLGVLARRPVHDHAFMTLRLSVFRCIILGISRVFSIGRIGRIGRIWVSDSPSTKIYVLHGYDQALYTHWKYVLNQHCMPGGIARSLGVGFWFWRYHLAAAL